MEIKVSVEGVQRIVCGVTEKTTCQEVVIALAQALGRTGRYTLREKFKEFERNVTPNERLLESLEKYGQQAREVQLTLQHLGPSAWNGPILCQAQLRRPEGGGRMRRGSGGAGLYRQSLPPLSRLRLPAELTPDELKSPKRKSLTLLEEAWGWLENLGKGGRQQFGRDKGKNKKDDEDGSVDKGAIKPNKLPPPSGALLGKDKKEKSKTTERQPIISCLGKHGREDKNENLERKEGEQSQKKDLSFDFEITQLNERPFVTVRAEAAELRRLIVQQQVRLRELELKIDWSDEQIQMLEREEERQKKEVCECPESTSQSSEEEEQLKLWLNELKAEEGYEKDLQRQFMELKEKAAECKNKLEEYKLQQMDLPKLRLQCRQATKPQEGYGKMRQDQESTLGCSESSTEGQIAANGPKGDDKDKTVISSVEHKLPYVLVSTNQLPDPQLDGPSELRKWWTRWTKAQKPDSGGPSKVVHRYEIKINLGSTRV